jgi:SRSO17 transposase
VDTRSGPSYPPGTRKPLVPDRQARARKCPVYVAGLIGAGDRKSVQPMAARDGEVGYDQLHHFIAGGVWDAAPLEKALLAEADRMFGGADAWLIVDDTALPKKGEHSVGVAPQYASSLGKGRSYGAPEKNGAGSQTRRTRRIGIRN